MRVRVHDPLPQEPDPTIRWPGAAGLPHTFDCSRLMAVSLSFSAETSKAEIERYATSAAESHKEYAFNATMYEPDIYPGSERFLLSRLVLREWTHTLHQDRMSIFFCREPAVTSRIRTYKGIFSKECRITALSYDQVEIETGRGTSSLLNRVGLDASASPSCLFGLADTFRAFAILGGGNSLAGPCVLTGVASCFGEVRGVWRWNAEKLIPGVCIGSSSLVFMQGAANETTLQMIAYIPARPNCQVIWRS